MNESCAVTPFPLFKGEPLNAPIILGLAMTIAGLLLSQNEARAKGRKLQD